MASQQRGGDRYCIFLNLLHKLLSRVKLLAFLYFNHLDVQNNKQSILPQLRRLLLHVTRRKMKLNCLSLPGGKKKKAFFSIPMNLIFKSQFHSISKHGRTLNSPDHTRTGL